MTTKMMTILAGVVLLMGFVLMVGGILTGKHGATVVGLCVAVASLLQLCRSSRK